jgi:hypothetical protein
MVPPRPLTACSAPRATRPRPAYLADLGAAAEEIGRLRWALRQVVALADEAPALTGAQLRQRLLALAERTSVARDGARGLDPDCEEPRP